MAVAVRPQLRPAQFASFPIARVPVIVLGYVEAAPTTRSVVLATGVAFVRDATRLVQAACVERRLSQQLFRKVTIFGRSAVALGHTT